jgi:integrase
MPKTTAGISLDQNTQCWTINKWVKGKRIYERTKYSKAQRDKAERRLTYLSEKLYEQELYGLRPTRTFREAAVKYCLDNTHLRTINWVENQLRRLDPYIGDYELDKVHKDCAGLQQLISDLRAANRKRKTINAYLEVVRRILNKAAYEWRDETNLSWLERAPRIRLLDTSDSRAPQPISWENQRKLLPALADHLADIALFIINTGARSEEVRLLQWEWEVKVPQGVAFIIPDSVVKGNTVGERMLVCNEVAASVVNRQRGKHVEHVFTYTPRGDGAEPRPIGYLNNNGWRAGCERAGLPGLHIHDLRHTFGYRLRQAGVDKQTRGELLGHAASDMTEHYSMADLDHLYRQVNTITVPIHADAVVTLRRRKMAVVA